MTGFGEDHLGHLFILSHNHRINKLLLKSEEKSIKAEIALHDK